MPSLYINKDFNYKNNKKNYSLEHVVPRSLIHKSHHNDMHNIFKTLKHYNTLRSNYKFTDTNSKDYDKKDGNWKKTADGTYYNFKKRMFIPLDNDKGIIARTILYMLYNYKYNTKKLIGNIDLIKWTSDYPPTEEEKYHNSIIKIHQYTDNIFISKYNKINYKNYIKYL
jgi:endonuclease I